MKKHPHEIIEKRLQERFKILGDEAIKIIVDTKTNIMYLSYGQQSPIYDAYGLGLTVMLDKQGKPLLYDGSLEN